MINRRRFLYSASVAAGLSSRITRTGVSSILRPLHRGVTLDIDLDDPTLRELAMRAIDAARAAGAVYADVRFTSDRKQTVSASLGHPFGSIEEEGSVYAGVRALVDGFWGFASATDCTSDVIVRLAQEAAAQAKANSWGTGRPVTLDDPPPAVTGSWSTPLVRDPFQVSAAEKTDFLHDLLSMPEVLGLSNVTVNTQLRFRRQERVFASTCGAFLTQTLFWTGPSDYSVTFTDPGSFLPIVRSFPVVPLQAGGYELVAALRPHDLPGMVEDVIRLVDRTQINMNKYNLVLDARTTAALVRSSIGYASELDRVRGYEVNAGGASYLTEAMLGRPIAHPSITVVGSRSVPHGPASVKWDDDGVSPDTFDIVKGGVLTDFATNRSHAPALGDWYNRRGKPIRSHGCAVADTAGDLPMIYPPDLTLHPASHDAGFEQLVADTRNGVAVLNGDCVMDQQQDAGQGHGLMFEIRNGQLGRYLGPSAAFLFRSGQLWKDVVALGGPSSSVLRGFESTKGEPVQHARHGVVAVPMCVRDVVVIDALGV